MKTYYFPAVILSVVIGLTLCTFTGCKKQDTANNAASDKQAEPAQAAAQAEQTTDAPIEIKPAPDENSIVEGHAFPNLEFTSLSGSEVNLTNLKGKIVLIDFWATWCGPCLKVMPDLIETYKEYHDKGFEIIGISLDRNQSQLESYIKDNKITWQQYYDGLFWNNKVARRFGIQAIPHVVIVDKNGTVYFNTDYERNKPPLHGLELRNMVAKLCSAAAS